MPAPSIRPDASTSDPIKQRQLARRGLPVQPSSLHPTLRAHRHGYDNSSMSTVGATPEPGGRRNFSPGNLPLLCATQAEQRHHRGRTQQREHGTLKALAEEEEQRGRKCERSLTPRPSIRQTRAVATQAATSGTARETEVERTADDNDRDDDRSLTPRPSLVQQRAMAAQAREREMGRS